MHTTCAYSWGVQNTVKQVHKEIIGMQHSTCYLRNAYRYWVVFLVILEVNIPITSHLFNFDSLEEHGLIMANTLGSQWASHSSFSSLIVFRDLPFGKEDTSPRPWVGSWLAWANGSTSSHFSMMNQKWPYDPILANEG